MCQFVCQKHEKGPCRSSAGAFLGTKSGAEGRPRSADTAIFSRVLYQLSYLGKRRLDAFLERRPTVGETGLEPVTFRV